MTSTEMPSNSSCPHCGKALRPLIVPFNGTGYHMGWQNCTCKGAVAAQEESEQRTLAAMRKKDAQRFQATCRKAGIPERYLDAEHPKAAKLAEAPSLYIHGAQGTGKTHLAMAIARLLIAKGKTVEVQIVPHLLEALRSRKVEDRGITARFGRCDLLVLDDLGKESPTPYACERLFDIVNDRYNANLPIIATSNYDLNALAKRLSEGDTGRSIASRLREMCQRIHMDGADRRRHG